MRPLKLTITNFRSFHHQTTIDFSKHLDEKDLFLITGDTGSGKSSILEAMTYALYGNTSKNIHLSSLVSQYAHDNEKMEVSFEFEDNNHHYRVVRSWKKKTAFELYRDGTLLTSKAKEGTDYLVHLLGLELNQFTQVIMLPQESMNRFLSASISDKEKVLRSLFQLDDLSQLRDCIKKHEQAANKEVIQQTTIVKEKLTYFDEQDHHNADDIMAYYQHNKEEVHQHIIEENEAKTSEIHTLQQSLEEQKEALANKEKAVERAKVINQARDDYNAALADQEALQEQAPVYDKTVAFNRQMDVFQTHHVFHHYETKKQLEEKLTEAHHRLLQKQEEYETLQAQKNEKADDYYAGQQKRNEQLHDLEKKQQRLQEEKEKMSAIQQLNEEMASLEKEVAQYEQQLEEAKAKATQYTEKSEALDELTHQKEQIEQDLKDLTENATQLAQYQTLEHQIDEQKALEDTISKQMEEVETARDDIRRDHQAKYDDYIQNMTMMIAHDLKEGDPCPVCGSCHHPNINQSQATKQTVTKEDLEKLEAKEQELNETLQQLADKQRKEQEKRQQLHIQQAQLHLVHQTDCIEEQLEQTKEKQAQLLQQKETCEAQMQELKTWLSHYQNDDDVTLLEEALAKCNNEWQQKKGQLQEKEKTALTYTSEEEWEEVEKAYKESFQQLTDEKEEAENDWNKLTDTITALKAKCQTLEEAWQRHQFEYDEAKESFEKLLYQLHISEALIDKWLPYQEEVTSARKFEEQYTATCREIEQRLKQSKEIFKDEERIDLAQLQDDKERLQQETQQIERTLWEAQKDMTQWQTNTMQLIQAIEESLSVMHNQQCWHRLYSLWGNQGQNVSIERFMMSHYFDQMVRSANQYLKNFSKQRYLLLQNNKKDLDLMIFDNETNATRSVETLSGGETFMCTLSLALGMSRVLSHNHGQININALFIDEGFGKLDEETIEEAVRLLNQLQRENNSLIGIITHIPALRESISKQLHVTKKEDGSHVQFKA